MIVKGTGGIVSWWTSGDNRNYIIIENSQNTEVCPGDLRRSALTETPVKKNQLKLM